MRACANRKSNHGTAGSIVVSCFFFAVSHLRGGFFISERGVLVDKSELEAYQILDRVDRFLTSSSAACRPDAKEQMRLWTELAGREKAAEQMTDMYLPPGEEYACVIDGYDITEVSRSAGANIIGIQFPWEELSLRVQELAELGRYMSGPEEQTYRQFKEATTEIWEKQCRSENSNIRLEAAQSYGEFAWGRLYDDPDLFVRGTVAMYSSEEIQMKMTGDSEAAVRSLLAQNTTDRVRGKMIVRGEASPEVLLDIAQQSSPVLLRQMLNMEKVRQLPEVVRVISERGGEDLRDEILHHADPAIAVAAIGSANESQCAAFLARENLPVEIKWEVEMRLEELKTDAPDIAGGELFPESERQ